MELNSFISRSADAFSYDDTIRFVRRGDHLEIDVVDPDRRDAWWRDGPNSSVYHGYWFYRALDEFGMLQSGETNQWAAENQEANQLAYIQTQPGPYCDSPRVCTGLKRSVKAESGSVGRSFQALLSLEADVGVHSARFPADLTGHLERSGAVALAGPGLSESSHGRNGADEHWPDGNSQPEGSTLPSRGAGSASGVQHRFRADQSNQSAFRVRSDTRGDLIDLRRTGADGPRRRRNRDESRQLGQLLAEERISGSLLTGIPPIEGTERMLGSGSDLRPRAGVVIVMGVKSSYLRRSQRDAWLHATTTLKAGQQLRQKIVAVRTALECNSI